MRDSSTQPASQSRFDRMAQRRVEYWTLGLGGGAALVVAYSWGWRASGGLALGALLAWLNYRWLKQAVASLVRVSTAQEGCAQVRIPKRIYVKLFGRYALLALALYVILTRLHWPALAFFCGLFALVAAVVAEMIYELARFWKQPSGER